RHASSVLHRVASRRLGRLRGRSAKLLDADHVPRGVAHRAVAHPVRLLGRLLDDLGAPVARPPEDAVEIRRGQDDAGEGALGHHLHDRAALLLGDAGIDGGRLQDDGRAGLALRTDRDPAHTVVPDVVADLEPETVPIEGHGGVGIVMGQETRMNADVHGLHATCGDALNTSRILTGVPKPLRGASARRRRACSSDSGYPLLIQRTTSGSWPQRHRHSKSAGSTGRRRTSFPVSTVEFYQHEAENSERADPVRVGPFALYQARRMGDLNPRRVAPYTLSKRA